MEPGGHRTARVGLEPVPGTAGVKPAGRGDTVSEPVPGAVDEAPAVKGAAAAEVAADALRVRLVARQHGTRPGVEAVGHAADGYGAARQRAGASRVVPGPAVEDPPGRHRAGRIKPAQGAVALVKAGSHGMGGGIKPVPGAADVGPAGGEGAGARRVVPCAAIEDPPGRHRAGGVKPVRGAIALMEPDGHGMRRGVEPIPGPIGIEPARMQRDRID